MDSKTFLRRFVKEADAFLNRKITTDGDMALLL